MKKSKRNLAGAGLALHRKWSVICFEHEVNYLDSFSGRVNEFPLEKSNAPARSVMFFLCDMIDNKDGTWNLTFGYNITLDKKKRHILFPDAYVSKDFGYLFEWLRVRFLKDDIYAA